MSELKKVSCSEQRRNRPIRSTGSQIVWVSAAVLTIMMGIFGGFILIEGLMNGRTYSVGIILGDSSMVDQTNAPQAFWTTIVLFSIDFLVCPIAGIVVL